MLCICIRLNKIFMSINSKSKLLFSAPSTTPCCNDAYVSDAAIGTGVPPIFSIISIDVELGIERIFLSTKN